MRFGTVEENKHVAAHWVELHLSPHKPAKRIKTFAHIGDTGVHKIALMFGDQEHYNPIKKRIVSLGVDTGKLTHRPSAQ